VAVQDVPQTYIDPQSLRVLRRVGVVDPGSLDSYRAAGGLQSLREAIAIGPTGVLRELKDAKLAGRGGAAFPTSVKWDSVARNPAHPHFVICNADESEPGTFKDRILMENDPFSIIESMIIAGFTTGSDRGYLYVRGEYPLAEQRILHAVGEARSRGLLGDDVMGAGFRFDIEVRRGAGAYIAGEETALFNSIEGRRPEPRNKPPFPVDAGLFGKPTAINNVETLCNVLEVLAMGGLAYAATGTSGSTGTRLFCVSGSVEHPGLYEVPFGVSLRHLLELAGGVRSGHDLAAVLIGGAAGSFIGPDQLDLELSMEAARDAGVMLGSGVIVVFDTATDFDHVVRRITRFFRDESCGQCVPCRVGTTRREELVGRLVERRTLGGRGDELALLADLGTVMRDASICALGQTATSAVESAVRLGIFAGAEEGS
jgi:NADH-quinone oxidoreductase subunit F